jgi:glycosyltransferase involved in cell wall biosynthesis
MFDAWTPYSRIREIAKHLMFLSVDGAKVSGEDARIFAGHYGLPARRTWRVVQSIDVKHFASAADMTPEDREARRAELDLGGCVFVYVGRMRREKGVGTLIQAYREARQANPDLRLLLVGDGLDEFDLRAQSRDIPGVVWMGFVQPADLPEIYALCDVMVFPTLGDPNGLVVEEAMAAGLPVISTEAAGDIRRRIPEGLAGYVVAAGEVEPLKTKMLELANSPSTRAQMAAAGRRIASGFDTTAYAADFERFVRGVLQAPRRKSPVAVGARCLGSLLAVTQRGKQPAPLLTGADEEDWTAMRSEHLGWGPFSDSESRQQLR